MNDFPVFVNSIPAEFPNIVHLLYIGLRKGEIQNIRARCVEVTSWFSLGVASYPAAEYLVVASSISNFDGKQTFPAEVF